MANDNIRSLDQKVYVAPQTAKDDTTSLAFDFFWRTSGAPVDTVSYEQSAMIDPEGQAPDSVKTTTEFNLEAETEYTSGDYDLFKRAIHGEETLVDVTGSDIEVTATGFDSGASDAFADLIAGDHFWVTGASDSDNNVMYIIGTKTSDNVVETTVAPASTEAAGASITVYSRKITSNINRYYDAFQERLPYDSGVGGIGYQTYINGLISSASFSIPNAGIITASASWLLGGKLDQKTQVSGQSDNSNPRNDTYSSDNVFGFWLNDESKTCTIKTAELSIDNQYETSDAAGCSAREFGKGLINVTTTLTAYTNSANPYEFKDYSTNSTDVSFAIGLQSNDGSVQTVYKTPRNKVNSVTTEPEANLLSTNFELNAQGSKSESTTITIYTNQ